MYSYIKGVFEEMSEGSIVVECAGVGYEISTSLETISNLPEIGSQVKIFTRLIAKEDNVALFGFYSKEERAMFDLLLTVSGIGPKGALSILSILTVDDIKFAIIGEDSKAFAKASGIGKRTAERIIVDLKDKVNAQDAVEGKLNSKKRAVSTIVSVREEALEALVALGYSPSNAAKALDKMTITESTTTEQLLSDTLKQMSFI